MIIPQDTIVHQNQQPVVEEPVEVLNAASPVDSASVSRAPKHPYQVLRQLPADATPAQQDSAIQATFHPEIKHISGQPDTLHLPGHDVGKSVKEVNIPQYYRENFFSKDPMYHPEINGGRYGMAGDPMPYAIRHDDVITGLLLGCFILVMIAFSRVRHFILRQIKDFFYIPRSERTTEVTETTSEFRFQFFLVFHTCILWALLCFFYVQENVAQTFILKSPYHLIALFAGAFLIRVECKVVVCDDLPQLKRPLASIIDLIHRRITELVQPSLILSLLIRAIVLSIPWLNISGGEIVIRIVREDQREFQISHQASVKIHKVEL